MPAKAAASCRGKPLHKFSARTAISTPAWATAKAITAMSSAMVMRSSVPGKRAPMRSGMEKAPVLRMKGRTPSPAIAVPANSPKPRSSSDTPAGSAMRQEAASAAINVVAANPA